MISNESNQFGAIEVSEKGSREQLKAGSGVQPHAVFDGDMVRIITGVSNPKLMKKATARVVRDVLVALGSRLDD